MDLGIPPLESKNLLESKPPESRFYQFADRPQPPQDSNAGAYYKVAALASLRTAGGGCTRTASGSAAAKPAYLACRVCTACLACLACPRGASLTHWLMHCPGRNRFCSIRFGSGRFDKTSVGFGSVRFGKQIVRFDAVRPAFFGRVVARSGPVRSGPVRFGSVRFASVRFGSVRFIIHS